ncbi:MAG: hypothetical protein A2Z93_06105 [Curvibacter sp. GWA2_64_110]|nr:MAG: hypothetical protein A2Z93_06105 [Curvibacter sp. GWA2_64_110]HCY15627.1 hypothetical protein [Curvibacter sp.]
MDYTQSDAFSTDMATGNRMHQDSAAVTTEVSAQDMNGIVWELISLIVGSGQTPVPFDKTNPASYTQVYQAVQLLISAAIASGMSNDYKTSVRFTTTGDIVLSGLGTQAGGDWGAALNAGDRILPKDQATGSENGIYIAAAGAWTRVTDADGVGELTSGAVVAIEEGATLADSQWMLTTDGAITIGTTALTFKNVSPQVVTAASDSGFVDNSAKPASTSWIRGAMSAIAAAAGFVASLGSSGYIKFPTWLGALIIQWGSTTTNGSGDGSFSFPLTFPNSLFVALTGGAGGNYYVYKETSRSTSSVAHSLTVSSTGGVGSGVAYNVISIGR